MEEYDYKILGQILIPSDKQDEMNQLVLEILDKGGIRKTKEIQLANKKVTVVNRPIVNEEGKVCFDYSIFEKIERTLSWYDTKTGELKAEKRGYTEYGVIMNLIMAIQEAYSETPCFLLYKDRLSNICICAELIRQVTGKELIYKHRAQKKYWDAGVKAKLYKAFDYLDEDEFIECWTEGELKLSDELKSKMEKWQKDYQINLKNAYRVNVEEELSEVITEMYEVWYCRYVSEEFIRDFMDNKEDVRYQAAVELLRQVVEEEAKFFPELTKKQVMRWLADRVSSYLDRRKEISCLVSLLSNKVQRYKILGF